MASSNFEQQMCALVPRHQSRTASFTNTELAQIQALLEGANKPSWASRPKIYTILRLLGCLDLMQGFVVDGLSDGDLPFSEDRLPVNLREDESLRDGFLRKQGLVSSAEPEKELVNHESVPDIVVSNEVDQNSQAHSSTSEDALALHPLMPPSLAASDLQKDCVDAANVDSNRRPASIASAVSDHSELIVDDHGSTTHLISDPDKIVRQGTHREKFIVASDTPSRPGTSNQTHYMIKSAHDPSASGKILQPDNDDTMKFPGSFSAPTSPFPPNSGDKIPLRYADRSSLPIPGSAERTTVEVRKRSLPMIPEPSISRASRILGKNDEFLQAVKDGNASKVGNLLSRNTGIIYNCASKDSWNALHFAAALGHVHVLRQLIPLKQTTPGALNSRTKGSDRTAIYLAAQAGHGECVSLLCDFGADLICASRTDGATPLHAAAQSGSESAVSMLLVRRAPVNHLDTEGMGPLMWGIRSGQPRVVTLLVQAGAELNRRTTSSRLTPLLSAVSARDVIMARHLISLGAKVDVDGPFYMTSLHKASLSGDFPMVMMLVGEARANLNAQNAEGFTPLHCAARYGSRQICQYLLQMGANPYAINFKGQTPYDIANYYKKHGVF